VKNRRHKSVLSGENVFQHSECEFHPVIRRPEFFCAINCQSESTEPRKWKYDQLPLSNGPQPGKPRVKSMPVCLVVDDRMTVQSKASYLSVQSLKEGQEDHVSNAKCCGSHDDLGLYDF
jgi:hypothetical protein